MLLKENNIVIKHVYKKAFWRNSCWDSELRLHGLIATDRIEIAVHGMQKMRDVLLYL